ncbi:unnamed protein product [marine sediment metagenome]|uniref:Uncharacterized protein n=1 Tax=marine sediment metagenome TaxID=412755 RepID=X1B1W6_9ZZZZ
MTETYYSEKCPKCNKKNFWYAGDGSDITGIDIEALICWSCGHKWLLEMCEEWTNLEEAYTEEGMRAVK